MMKRVLFTLLALCGLFVGLQAQNTNTSNKKGVTATGQLDTVRNTRVQSVPALQTGFVSPMGEKGNRPRLARTGQRLKAVIKVISSSMVSNSVLATTATIAATVSDSGDYALPVIERGVCYATTANPTLLTATKVADATISGKGFGNFEVSLSGLQPHTAYHARAYAVSLYDTVYGEDLTFTILVAGALPGKFTINSDGDQVYFSQGNLQYQASTNTWRFAEHQWNYVGDDNIGNVYVGSEKSDNKQISSSYTGWIDLFGWGTSGYNHGATCYQPYSTSSTDASYNPYGSLTSNLFDNNGQADWGYNAISNGGNTENSGWRTLKNDATHNEWQYIFDIRETGNTVNSTAHARYTLATINKSTINSNVLNGDKGIILFPDTYNGPTGDVTDHIIWGPINASSSYSSGTCTKCTAEGWATLEAAGCVFLPAAGFRTGSSASYVAGTVDYWSSSYYNDDSRAYSVHIVSSYVGTDYQFNRYNGLSVRLVRDAN